MDTPATTAVLDALPDPVLLLDSTKSIVAANQSARDLLGNQIKGRSLALAIRDPEVLDAVNEVLSGGDQQQIGISLMGPFRRNFDIQVASLADTAESSADAILIMHDMTATRNAEQMRSDFVANVSHELRSPLSSLVGFIETLRGAARDDEAARETSRACRSPARSRRESLLSRWRDVAGGPTLMSRSSCSGLVGCSCISRFSRR